LKRTERASRGKQTPLLVVDRGIIRQRFIELKECFGNAGIYYAVKTNPHWRILKLLKELGSGFEISSEEELNILLRRGVSPDRIIASNPVKTEACIRSAYTTGIKLFALDSYAEIEKLSRLAPKSKAYVRLTVSNDGSQWPLTKKFGVETDDAVNLLVEARKSGLEPCGLTFHVGSQNTESEAWVKALEKSRLVWDKAKERGIELKILNIGGGFPIKYMENSYSISNIAADINETVNQLFPETIEVLMVNQLFPETIEVLMEPGRFLVGEAGILVGTVIGKAARNGGKWLYLDVGVFNGLMETVGGIQYPMTSLKNGGMEKWVLAGPSCDSLDIVQNNVVLPDLAVGDQVYILSAGAYTTAYASQFDGAPVPRITCI
jgi:ornithine decarboxylase